MAGDGNYSCELWAPGEDESGWLKGKGVLWLALGSLGSGVTVLRGEGRTVMVSSQLPSRGGGESHPAN